DSERTNRSLTHFVGEHVLGMKALKAMSLEAPVIAKADIFFERIRSLNFRSLLLRSNIQVVVQLSGVLFVGIVFAVMYRSPGFSIAAFAVIVYAMNQIFAQIQAGQTQLHTITTLLPYTSEALAYLDRARENEETLGGEKGFSIKRELEFRDISFTYPERGEVLSQVSFTLPKGSLTGIIGPSGSGKTTIADLLLRLIEPQKGAIFIDGLDAREIPVKAWRTHIGYVSQDAVLLNDTIASNISFYSPSLTREDVIESAKLANVHEFIKGLPEGYDTRIGDRGILLSGGQRQRVALARVLARKPELLVLDEATSSLDSASERAIQKAIDGLHGDITVVVIAHRLTTVSGADCLIVLKDGRVTEKGSPKELLKNDDSYMSTAMNAHKGNIDADV
ncbi:MAG: ATP-binding cassette domain-containing protein, partial [Patescibacteria group bacterium]